MADGADGAMDQLVALMAALRTPGTGCAWDLEQDFATIAPYTLEEAYEVADAIARGDLADLRDELGDLLFQVVFHARMAEEQGAFSFGDVVSGIVAKMTRRHPHVFGDAAMRTATEQTRAWEQIKAQERAGKTENQTQAGALAGVATALPALKRAQKLQQRAARVGFDWPDAAGARDKVIEEMGELEGAATSAAAAEEAGDLLFAVVNYVRKLGLDAETALEAANRKFIARFEAMEELAVQRGERFEALDLEAQDALWNQIKTIR